MNEERLEITETLYEAGDGSVIPSRLTAFIAALEDSLARVPASYRSEVRVELDAEEVYGVWIPTIRAWYKRQESDDEYNHRIERERQRLAMHQHNNEILERREFERLQAKYGQKG